MKRIFFVVVLFICLVVNYYPASKDFTGQKETVVKIVPNSGNTLYAWGDEYNIGHEYYSYLEETQYFRTKYSFELTGIPTGATINSVILQYSTFNNKVNYKFTITLPTNVIGPEQIWNEIKQANSLFSNIAYGTGTSSSQALTDLVNNNLGSTIYLGVYSQNEINGDSESLLDLTITIEYTVPPTILNITAKNNMDGYEGGNIGVGKNTSAASKSSPYPFTAVENDNINLLAYENQNYSGYNWIWNDTEGAENKSKWVKETVNNTLPLGNTQSKTYQVQSGDDGVNLIGYLRKYYDIKRDDDCSEFDNVINNGVVTNIVEQNSGTISAPATNTVNGRTYTFAGWTDGNTNNPRTIAPVDNETYTALYKYKFHSNDINAYSANGQRKVAKTTDGVIHSVYESNGKVWYEYSSDGGQIWTLASYLFNGGGNAKNPSVASYLNNIIITYQAEVNGYSEIKVELFQKDVYSNNYLHKDNLTIQEDVPGLSWSYSDDYTPVIAVGAYNFLVAFNTSGSIIYRLGGLDVNNSNIWWRNDKRNISGTNASDYNLSIASLYGNTYHLAWQYSQSSVRYCSLILGANNEMTVSSIETVSSGSGYTKNYNPSITVMNNNVVRVGWVGYKVIPNMKKAASENILGTPYYQAVMREKTSSGWSSVFYKRGGSNVSTVNINRSSDNNSVLSWVQGTTCKYILNKSSSISTLSVSGNYIQLSNGTTTSEMKAVTFSTSTPPYPFTVSSLISAPKTNNNTYSAGREGIISKDGAEFYFVIGDVTLDGNNVAFTPIAAEVDSSNYFSYLESESMSVNDNSSLTYSVLYGFVDSAKVAEILTENKEINFSVELVDANTEELLGVYDNVTYNSGNLYQYDNIAYSLNMNGIGSREVKLRLRIEENINGKYTLADITAEEELLPKTSVKELSYQGALAVKEYALEQNYPNPFNPSTTIKYQLPRSGNVKLVIYDMLGREVKTLVNGFKQKGRYEVQFDASGLSSGVYIYRIEANVFSASRKMVLLK